MPKCKPDNANTCEAPDTEKLSRSSVVKPLLSPSVIAATTAYASSDVASSR